MMRFYETLPTEHRWQVSKRINEICPAHWERIRLNEIARVQNGFAFKSKFFSKNGDGFPLIRIRDVGAPDTETNYSGEFDPEYIVRHGDIIIGMDGEFRCRKWLGRDALLNQRVCRLVPTSNDVHIEFFFKILQLYLDAVEQVTSSVTVKHLSSHTVEDLELPLPPIAEQRRIVAKIEALQERSRRAREALLEVGPLLEQFWQSMLTAAFRGDLTADWRAAHPHVEPASELLHRIRAERCRRWEQAELAKYEAKGQKPPKNWKEKYKKPEPIDDSDLPELPEGWIWTAAEEIVEPEADIVYGIVQPGKHIPNGVPYVRGKDIQNGRILVDQLLRTSESIAKKYERASLKGGDILLGIIRATKVAIVPNEIEGGNITQGTARFRPSSVIRTYYLAGWLDSPAAQAWLHNHYRGIDMPGLNLRDVRRLPTPLAPLAEQEALEEKLSEFTLLHGSLMEVMGEGFGTYDQLDQAILAKAFRGELVPQDPNDEPASALLERIREQRAQQVGATTRNKKTSQTQQGNKTEKKASRLTPEQLTLAKVL